MKKTDVDLFAQSLRQQRNDYVREFRQAEAALEAIDEERESELEEHAQEEQTARLLARLDDRTLLAIKEIDAALQRILQGRFGVCERCHKAISLARLKALPATRLCKTCAAKNETAAPRGATVESPSAAPVPPDLNLLNDRELNQTIRERLKDDGRIDLDELHVVCRKGVVHLSGKVPSRAEHEILLQTVTDVLGFREITDHVEIEELLWENNRRAKEVAPQQTQRWEESPGTEDVIEATEEDQDYVAPAKPTPGEQ